MLSTSLLLGAALSAFHLVAGAPTATSAAATTATKTSATATATKTAYFDNLPPGPLINNVEYDSLAFQGDWSIVPYDPLTTYFEPESSPNFLVLSGSTGNITAPKGYKFAPQSYYVGCVLNDAPYDCQYEVVYPYPGAFQPGDATFDIYLHNYDGNHLEAATGGGPPEVEYMQFIFYEAPNGTQLFIDNFSFTQVKA